MPLLTIAIIIIIVGVLLYLANRYIPMDGNVKKILNVAVCVILVLWLLQVTGLLSGLGAGPRVGG